MWFHTHTLNKCCAATVAVSIGNQTSQEMALAAALDAAASAALDLVEVNPRGQPPVARWVAVCGFTALQDIT
jgi:translation initiation factor IF-3